MISPNFLGLLISHYVTIYQSKYTIFILIECKRFLLAHQWQIRLQFVSNAKGRRRERERERGAEKKSRSLRQKCDEKERRK